jgi:hypothetical protein
MEIFFMFDAITVNCKNKEKQHKRKSENWLCVLAVVLFFAFSAPLSAQQVSSETTASAPSQAPPDSSPNAMTRAVVQRGMLSCAARVEQVTRFLGFGPQAGGYLIPPPAPTDQRLFSLQLEVSAGATANSFVDMSFAPQQANGCGATYQSVTYWPQSCETVGSQHFANFKPSKALVRDVAVLDVAPLTKVFLMKAGTSGCISIKKEIVS